MNTKQLVTPAWLYKRVLEELAERLRRRRVEQLRDICRSINPDAVPYETRKGESITVRKPRGVP